MTINQMRSYISDKYPGLGWKQKVASMPTNQVIAVYKSFMNRKPKAAAKVVLAQEVKEDVFVEPEPHQMDIWEWAYMCNEANCGKETHSNIKI